MGCNTLRMMTPRRILRRFIPRDAQALMDLIGNEDVNRFFTNVSIEIAFEAEKYLEENDIRTHECLVSYRYAICLKESDIPV